MKATSHIKHDYTARKFCLSGGGGGGGGGSNFDNVFF